MSDTKEKDPAKMTEEQLKIHDLERENEGLKAELKREKSACDIYEQFPRLYSNYKQRTDEDIREKLEDVSIVIEKHNGVGTEYGYYSFKDEYMEKVKKNPRSEPMMYSKDEVGDNLIKGLVKYKTFYYLVQSSSRFFLKDDIGEVLDQVPFHDWYSLGGEIKSICIEEGYSKVPGTEGEHFLKRATLLVPEGSKILERVIIES